ncbi:MAG: PIN domain-containing protein [Ardenticatenaceae bacterium]|nr:PIN domain-containing protein [Ardenticatenaceae bacterium]MCB8946227.1 PIN domain-containing protein [Ardenticatenaceae bacterium]
MPTVFVDANILIAGSASRTGASRAVLGLGEMGLIQLVVCKQVIDEAERNIRLKLPQALPIFAELLVQLNLQIVADPHPSEFGRWLAVIEAKDAPILAAAVQHSPNYFLTLNSKDFTPEVAAAAGLIMQTPAEFIQNVREVLSQNL